MPFSHPTSLVMAVTSGIKGRGGHQSKFRGLGMHILKLYKYFGGDCPYQSWEGEEKWVSEDLPEHRLMMTQKFSTQTLILKLLIETLVMVLSMRGLKLTNIYPKCQKYCWKFQHFLSPTSLYFF